MRPCNGFAEVLERYILTTKPQAQNPDLKYLFPFFEKPSLQRIRRGFRTVNPKPETLNPKP